MTQSSERKVTSGCLGDTEVGTREGLLFGSGGRLWHRGASTAYGGQWGFAEGDAVTCELDMDKRRVRWRIGTADWLAHRPLPSAEGAYSFGVSMHAQGNRFSVVELLAPDGVVCSGAALTVVVQHDGDE